MSQANQYSDEGKQREGEGKKLEQYVQIEGQKDTPEQGLQRLIEKYKQIKLTADRMIYRSPTSNQAIALTSAIAACQKYLIQFDARTQKVLEEILVAEGISKKEEEHLPSITSFTSSEADRLVNPGKVSCCSSILNSISNCFYCLFHCKSKHPEPTLPNDDRKLPGIDLDQSI